MKNERLNKIKTQVKKYAPKVLVGAIVIASTACAIVLKQKLDEERKRFPVGGSTKLAACGTCLGDDFKAGEPLLWEVKGHTIDLAYDLDPGSH